MYAPEKRELPREGRFCCYLRKSREEEKAELAGFDNDVLGKHDVMLHYTAEMRGHEIERVYREVKSGETIAERDDIKKLIKDVEDGMWDGIYVMAVDRISRGGKRDQGAICDLLECTGTFVITPGGYYDPLNEQDLDAIAYHLDGAHREYKAYVRRLHDGAVVSVLQGQFIGARRPYGFEKIETEQGLKSLKAIEEEAKWVRKMYEWYDEGMTMWGIANKLNELGAKRSDYSSSAGWRKESVTYILGNPVYAGYAVWGRHSAKKVFCSDVMESKKVHYKPEKYTIAEALWEPIVDRELFERVQERIKKNRPFAPTTRTVNPLAYMLVCSKCGRSMLYLIESKSGKRRYQHQNWCAAGCGQKGAFADVVIDCLADTLKAHVEDIEISLEEGRATKEREQAEEAVATFTRKLDKLYSQDRNLIIMRSKEEITATELRIAREEVAAEREFAEQRLAEAERALERESEAEALAAQLHTVIDALKSDELDGKTKNAMLREVIDRIEYTNDSDFGHNDRLVLDVVLR